MRKIGISFYQMLKFVKKDKMLLAACLAPIIFGICIHNFLPMLEQFCTQKFGKNEVLTPYYPLMEFFFAVLTPVMFGFIAAMVVLEEMDDHVQKYLFVTGLGKRGYFISRIFIPEGIALVVTVILLPFFQITHVSVEQILLLAFSGMMIGIMNTFLILTIASNKLEGMAVMKLVTITVMGIFIPYIVSDPLCYVAAFLPVFWVGKALYEGTFVYIAGTILVSAVWICACLVHLMKK